MKMVKKDRNLSEEDKNKRKEYGKNRYHNISEEKKQKLKEYRKKYREKARGKYINLSKEDKNNMFEKYQYQILSHY